MRCNICCRYYILLYLVFFITSIYFLFTTLLLLEGEDGDGDEDTDHRIGVHVYQNKIYHPGKLESLVRSKRHNGYLHNVDQDPEDINDIPTYHDVPGFGKVPKYLPQFRNPCWYEPVQNFSFNLKNPMCDDTCKETLKLAQKVMPITRRHVLRCLPYFFLIGPQKCGTTDLFDNLLRHPQIGTPQMKESHYWARHHPNGVPLNDYVDMYHRATKSIENTVVNVSSPHHRGGILNMDRPYHPVVTGDGSATTIWDNWDWQTKHPGDTSLPPHRIHALLPNAKILLILRHPIQRLISDYVYFSPSPSRYMFTQKVKAGITWLNDCYRNNSRSHCIYSRIGYKEGNVWSPHVRLRLGLYAEFLMDWLVVFPRSQIHVETLDDYTSDKLATLTRIFRFLDLDRIPPSIEKDILWRSQGKKNSATKRIGTLEKDNLKLLHEFYDPFNRKLANMLKRTLPWCENISC